MLVALSHTSIADIPLLKNSGCLLAVGLPATVLPETKTKRNQRSLWQSSRTHLPVTYFHLQFQPKQLQPLLIHPLLVGVSMPYRLRTELLEQKPCACETYNDTTHCPAAKLMASALQQNHMTRVFKFYFVRYPNGEK